MNIELTSPYKEFLGFYKSEDTIRGYSNDFKTFINYLKSINKTYLNAKSEDLRAYVVHLKSTGIMDRSIKRRLAPISVFYKWLCDEEKVDKDPTFCFKRFDFDPDLKKPKPISAESRIKLMETMTFKTNPLTDIALLLAWKVGMRLIEIFKSKWEDIDWDANSIHIIGKGNKPRDVPLSPMVHDKLKEFKASGSIFGLSKDAISYRVIHRFKSLNIKATCHCLRHTFGTELAEKGASMEVIAELMGHSSTSITRCYVEIAKSKKQETVNLLG
jgi:integrase/recombinase XerD